MPNQDHPVWFIGKVLLYSLSAVYLLGQTQPILMKTEYKMLMEIAAVLFGGAALESFFRKKTGSQ